MKRAIGSADGVTVDFNPRKGQRHSYKSSIGTTHKNAPSLRDSYFWLVSFIRGLKSTVTTSSEPTALLSVTEP